MSDTMFPKDNPSLIKKIPKTVWIAAGAVLLFIVTMSFIVSSGDDKKEPVTNANTKTEYIDDMEKRVQKKKNNQLQKVADVVKNPIDDLSFAALKKENEQQNKAKEEQTIQNDTKQSLLSQVTAEKTFKKQMQQPAFIDYTYRLPRRIGQRFDENYQKMVSHFKSNKAQFISVDKSVYKHVIEQSDALNKIEAPLKNLYAGAQYTHDGRPFIIPSGTMVHAITDKDLSSDHPGDFLATITRPQELKGMKLLCSSSSNQRDRIPVTVTKIINPFKQSETTLSAQAQMKYPGLTGNVQRHILRRVAPAIINTALGVGSGYLYYRYAGETPQETTAEGRIDTRDVVAGEMYNASVQAAQNEISRFSGEYPNTVTVPAGTRFQVLIRDAVEIRL